MNTSTQREWSMSTLSPNQILWDFWGNSTTGSPLSTSVDTTLYDYEDYNLIDTAEFEPVTYARHGAYFLPVLFTVFFIFGVAGNVLVLWVIACGVRLRSMTDVCLLNLAVADLLLVSTLPFLAHQAWDQWRFGDTMCKLVLGVYNVVFYGGIFFICLMSIDRYLAVVHAVYALRVRTASFGMMAAGITWILGFLASFPDNLFLQAKSMNDKTLCFPFSPQTSRSDSRHFWRIFSIFKMNTLGLLVPLFFMGFCYSQILWRLMSCQTSKRQAIRLVLVVVAAFFCCWVPLNVASFFRALELMGVYTDRDQTRVIMLALQVTEAVSYSHCCLNPVLYVFVGEKFRRHLLRLISRAPCSVCRVIKVLLPQDRGRSSVYSQTSTLDERSTAV